MSGPDKVRANGWLQGKVVSAEALASLIKPEIPFKNTDFFVVISQDCDVINPDYEKEPFIELIKASPVDKPDGAFSFGKNPRKLCFKANINDVPINCIASIHDKIRISRQLLEKITPKETIVISQQDSFQIATWTAKRYIRPAFPDEFIMRTSPVSKKIAKLLEKKGYSFVRLYLLLNSQAELAETEKYEITLYGIVEENEFIEHVKVVMLQQVLNEIVTTLNGCKGITAIEGLLRSKRQVTLEDLDYLFEWDFDYISNQQDNN